MGKDIETIINYVRDHGPDDTFGDQSAWKRIVLGHDYEDPYHHIVHDVRGQESSFSLDENGFEIRNFPTKKRDVENEKEAKEEYLQEVARMITEMHEFPPSSTKDAFWLTSKRTGAKKVIPGGMIIRSYKRDELAPEQFIPGQRQGPSPKVHIDALPDPEGARIFARNVAVGIDVDAIIDQSSRWQVLGIWRPLKTVKRDPLAFSDPRTVPDEDYRYLKGPRYGTTLLARPKDGMMHRWYYCSDMKPDEVAILKHFDSKKDLPASRCAHTSIALPGTEHLPARESIEVRAVVCY